MKSPNILRYIYKEESQSWEQACEACLPDMVRVKVSWYKLSGVCYDAALSS